MSSSVFRLAAFLAVAPVCGLAQDAAQPRDFTFKRLSVSNITPGKRITVQIDPVEQAALLAAGPKVDPHPEPSDPQADPPQGPLAPVAPAGGNYDWYWDQVPVARSASDGRWGLAIAALNNGPGGKTVNAPRLQIDAESGRNLWHRDLEGDHRHQCVARAGAGGDGDRKRRVTRMPSVRPGPRG